MIYFENVTKQYANSDTFVLKDISFYVERGEFVFIIGGSGAGKSTITKLIIAEEKQTSGSIYVNDVNVAELKDKEIPAYRRSLGIVFQEFRLLSTKNIYDNIAFPLRIRGASNDEIEELVPQWLDLVRMTDKAYSMPSELSGGERQRAAIARAMVNNPSVLIADEPTGNLDPIITAEIMDYLRQINEMGTTILVVTHDPNVVNSMQKRVIELNDGYITRDMQRGGYTFGY
ncbi:MAG: ATP-binding cassette domain-containing protein [Clostridia bacterium]|nr:ATP-binding cassette domain-containing protein [Clostridia bacterium]